MDIIVNLVSDFVFVLLIIGIVWCLNWLSYSKRFGRAQQFFGVHHQIPIKIYVSGFEHPGVKTKRVVNAIEYEVAVKIRYAIQKLLEGGTIHRLADFLAGLIGQDFKILEPKIEISPLEEVKEAPYQDSIILIGGPVSNQISKFYLQDSPRFRFEQGKYQKRDGNEYQDIESSGDIAIIEKRIVGKQIVFLIHGFGEEQTQRAAYHLIEHWETLYKQYETREFGVLVDR